MAPPVRRSRRLSGAVPDVSLADAQKAVDSPVRAKAISSRGRQAEAKKATKKLEAIFEENDKPKDVPKIDEAPKEVAKPVEIKMTTETSKPDESTLLKEKSSVVEEKTVAMKANKKPKADPNPIIKGSNKSGRFWKSDRDRFRSIIKSKGLKQSYKNRLKQREAVQRAKELEQMMKEEKKQKLEELKKRQEINKQNREKNERKSEVVQVIKNPAKIKRMKKKQLRKLVKRDTTVVQKNPVTQ